MTASIQSATRDPQSAINWAVVGSGGIARRRTIPEGIAQAVNARLRAVFGTNERTNAEVGAQFGAQACDSLQALLASDVQAVYVASPVHAHHDQVLACARAGKHVFCEKPLGRNAAEAEAMVRACREAGVQLGTAFMMRYQAQHEAAAKMIAEGRLGKPVYARAQLSCWYPPLPQAWRQDPTLGGGGPLIDLGSHCIDLLEMMFGPVATVSCFTQRNVHSYSSEDSAAVLLQFSSGALGTVDTFFCIQDDSSRNRLELYGSQGSILAEGTIGQGSEGQMRAFLQAGQAAYSAKQARAASDGVEIRPPAKNIYRAEVEEFSAALLAGRSTEGSAAAGLRSQRITDACYESAASGRRIEIPRG